MTIVSIIIPTLNEGQSITSTLARVTSLQGNFEIILVDGGSGDDTLAQASNYPQVTLVSSPPGRAQQMNQGAQQAAGDILLFLHSDSILHPQAVIGITAALERPEVVGGCFTLAIDDPRFIFTLVSLGSNMRAKLSRVYFGDQGIFVRKHIFHQLGGFPLVELMEDWEFSKAMAKIGPTVQLPQPIVTSARRWHKGGVWRTIWLMHKLKLLYLLGTPPAKLKELYYRDVR